MKSTLTRGITLLSAIALVPLAALPASAAASAPASARAAALLGSWSVHNVSAAPRLPLGTQLVGPLASTTTIRGAVALSPSNDQKLESFITTVTNKDSSLYHHYLAPDAFRREFGPSASAITAVSEALTAGGLRVTSVASDGLLVNFSGTAARASATFHTGLDAYRLVGGAAGRATTGAASLRLPTSVARDVVGIVGLDQLVQAQSAGLVRGTAAARRDFPAATAPRVANVTGAPSACSAADRVAAEYGGLTDNAIADAYGAGGLYSDGDTGVGQHVAVYELEPFSPSDIETFDTCYFGATQAAQMSGTGGDIDGSQLSLTNVDGGLPPGDGSGESALDIEDVSGMAPGADIDVYEAPNTSISGLDEYSAIINNDEDQIVTSSWGVCEQLSQYAEPGLQEAENGLFQQAAAQGQTIFSAEGDTGSDSCNEERYDEPPSGQNELSVLDPASQPYVVSVGGTTIDAATQPPSEHVWNDGAEWGAGGGGISESWAMPSWQASDVLGPTNTAQVTAAEALETASASTAAPFATPTFCDGTLDLPANTPCRETPDVSAQADEFTGAVTVEIDGYWGTIGGTSSATPIWASLLALVNASTGTGCATELVNGVPDVGFASPILYGIAANPTAYAASFNDITSGNNDIYGLDDGASFAASTGYDMASGLGSPQLTSPTGGIGLAYYMCSYGTTETPPTVTSLSPSTGTTAGGEAVIVAGTGFGTAETPLVKSVQVGNGTATSFTVIDNTTLSVTLPAAATTVPAGSPSPTQDGAGPAEIIVTSTSGTSSAPSGAARFQYVDMVDDEGVPSVTSLGPDGGLDTAPATVTIWGSGFTAVQGVDFGGVAATNVTVVSPFELTATPPLFSALTPATACPVDNGSAGQPLNPSDDVCQVEVTVTTATGTSATASILQPFEGPLTYDSMGAVTLPANCDCEDEPQTTEYDYAPAPTVTSTSTGTVEDLPANAALLASEEGGSPSDVVTVTGTGLDPLTFEYGFYGTSGDQLGTYYPVEASGTSMVLDAPNLGGFSNEPFSLPVGVATFAGNSPINSDADVVYAGIPEMDDLSNTANANRFAGASGAPDTGGAPLELDGSGFSQVTGPIGFEDLNTDYSLGTQYTYSVVSDSEITTESVAQNPAVAVAEVCSTTGCSFSLGGVLIVYPPGAPTVTSVSPASGTPLGGTTVDVHGRNLGCVVSVDFGSKVAESVTSVQALLDCGSTDLVTATSPVGTPGAKVKVVVTTAESVLTGATPVSTGMFTYAGRTGSPEITTSNSDTVTTLKHFSFPLAAKGSGAITWTEHGVLPKGVTFKSLAGGHAVLSGTPAAGTGGVYYPRFTASNHDGSLGQPFTLDVDQRPTFTAASTWTVTEGAPAVDVVTAAGFPTPGVYVSGTLPRGLTAVSEPNGTVVISGTPLYGTAKTYHVTFHGSNAVGRAAFTLKIVVKV